MAAIDEYRPGDLNLANLTELIADRAQRFVFPLWLCHGITSLLLQPINQSINAAGVKRMVRSR